ncbi:PKD domain-containing protein [Actinocrispum wychmicini]|uniref:PKD domain-containing protein n=1 Tax=Actinocrispum wychmicini TaxID=1213861 RepID=A0A4R2JC09_9PSEU|nr:PKD domain-containing protein [Actinocrispum wychmicini]TCO57053.1 hypothetical protein EV192_106530 [Actinocrispum wychmicini]
MPESVPATIAGARPSGVRIVPVGGVIRVRGVAAGLAAAVVVGVLVVAGTSAPTRQVRLLSGAAWLASAKVGQLTLLDGATAEVSAQLQVASADDQLAVAQLGSTAYAVDQTTGTVRRVDGATFAATPPRAPVPDAHAGLTAVPGATDLYILDTQRGVLANADPHTLDRRGDLLSVAGRLGPGTVTVDDSGTLWAIDTATGDLNRIAGGTRTVQHGMTKPGTSFVTIANGHPVVVDTTGRKAIVVDKDSGRAGRTLDLDLRPDDTVRISGSPHSERIYVVAERGVLDICDLGGGRCDSVVPLAKGHEFGAPVDSGDRVFVPDYSTGEVWIVDLGDHRLVARPMVLPPIGPFQLLVRDGVVFYNDPGSEKAGVIRLDGAVTPTAKYDPGNPRKGLTAPGGTITIDTQPAPPSTGKPAPDNPRSQQPSSQQPSSQQQVPSTSQPDQPPVEPPPSVPDPTSDPRPPPSSDPGKPPLELKITMSDTTPTAHQQVALTVSGAAIDQATWSFGDGGTATGISVNHTWTAARNTPYLVAVNVTTTDGRQGTVSVQVPVSDVPKAKLTVRVTGDGVVAGSGISCPGGQCTITVDQGTTVTLKATSGQTATFSGWGDACAGRPGDTCQLSLTNDTSVSAAFQEKPTVTLTLQSAKANPSGGPISGRIHGTSPGDFSCQLPCAGAFPLHLGDQVTLVAEGAFKNVGGIPTQTKFVRWEGGPCDQSTALSCSFQLSGNVTITGFFIQVGNA